MYLLSLVTLAFAVKLTALVLTDASVVAAAAVDWSWLIEDIVVIVVAVATTVVVEFVVVDVNFSAVADCCSLKRLIYMLLFKAYLFDCLLFKQKKTCVRMHVHAHIFLAAKSSTTALTYMWDTPFVCPFVCVLRLQQQQLFQLRLLLNNLTLTLTLTLHIICYYIHMHRHNLELTEHAAVKRGRGR